MYKILTITKPHFYLLRRESARNLAIFRYLFSFLFFVTILNLKKLALSIVLDWCRDFGLSINPSKTDVVLFSKLDNGVGSGVYSGKLDLNISLRLPDYCSVFQAEVISIYRAVQWILVNRSPFTCVSVVSDSQAAIRSLSGFVNTSRIVREILSGRQPMLGQ